MNAFESRLLERAGASSLSIPATQLGRFSVYADLLERWNRRINLTALPLAGWPDATLDRLFLEPIAAAPLADGLSGRWVDLGSGGGSPALPLAIASTGLTLSLTESRGKKAAFLREAIRSLELDGATVLGRFEELMTWSGGSAVLLSCRAVNPEETLEVANHLLSSLGRMLYFGSSPLHELGHLTLESTLELPGVDALVSVLTKAR